MLISGNQKYSAGLVPLLTDLYDCPTEFEVLTVGRGREKLKNVCISVLGAGVPMNLQAQLPPEAVKGGFLPRFILGVLPSDWKVRVAVPPGVDARWWGEMVEEAREIVKQGSGPLRLSKEAFERFVSWYEEELDFGETEIEDAYLQRIPEQTLRVALLFHLCARTGTEISVETFEEARRFVWSLWLQTKPLVRVFASNPRMRSFYHAIGVIERLGFVTKSKLIAELAPYVGSVQELEKTVSLVMQHPSVRADIKGKEVFFQWKNG